MIKLTESRPQIKKQKVAIPLPIVRIMEVEIVSRSVVIKGEGTVRPLQEIHMVPQVDGKVVNSCITLAMEVDGCQITTVEGLAEGVRPEQLDVIQQAYLDAGAVQCGYCTPGFLMATRAFLRTNPDPTDEEIRLAFEGHLCRCTGYTQIVEAIQAVADGSKE